MLVRTYFIFLKPGRWAGYALFCCEHVHAVLHWIKVWHATSPSDPSWALKACVTTQAVNLLQAGMPACIKQCRHSERKINRRELRVR